MEAGVPLYQLCNIQFCTNSFSFDRIRSGSGAIGEKSVVNFVSFTSEDSSSSRQRKTRNTGQHFGRRPHAHRRMRGDSAMRHHSIPQRPRQRRVAHVGIRETARLYQDG